MRIITPDEGEIYEGQNAVLMARVTMEDGTAITQALSTTDLTVTVYDMNSETPQTNVHEVTVAEADAIFDTLQTGEWGGIDDQGYNVLVTIADSAYSFLAGHNYRITASWTVNDTGNTSFPANQAIVVWKLKVRSALTD